MAQINNYKKPNDKIWIEGIEELCLICQNPNPYDIFWDMGKRKFYVCKDCEYIIKGLYKDVIFQEAEDKNLFINEIIKNDIDKIHNIVEMRDKNKMFKYVICGGIIDWFEPSFTLEELISNIKAEESEKDVRREYEIKFNQINEYLLKHDGEKPHTIRFFSIPNFEHLQMDVYAIAKVSNNGSTYVFGDNPVVLNLFVEDEFDKIENATS